MQGSDYFSNDYPAARRAFLSAAREAGAAVESFQNPHQGPANGPLMTDLAMLGQAQAESILLLISATHGVEGFAGSAIQTGLLQTLLSGWSDARVGIILVHALNPYGFACLRRCNEDNVDLNRNFIDHKGPYPENQAYERLSAVLAPKSYSRSDNLLAKLQIAWYRLRYGHARLQQTVTGGQYTDPRGLFYGGRSMSWSNRILHEIATRYLDRVRRLIAIDVHTGLGPYGYGELVLNHAMDDPAYQRAVAWWGEERVASTVTGNSVSSHLSGTLNLALAGLLPDAEVTAVGLEFGTLKPLEVFKAIRAENWLHHYGGPGHPAAARIKEQLLRAFSPDDRHWQDRVWQQGRLVTEQALSALAG